MTAAKTDPRAARIAELDKETGRLDSLRKAKQQALDADLAKNANDMNFGLQDRLVKEIAALQVRASVLRDERFGIEVNGIPPAPVAKPTERKLPTDEEWDIKADHNGAMPMPEYPRGWRVAGRQDELNERSKAVEEYVKQTKFRRFRDAGVHADEPADIWYIANLTAEIEAMHYWLSHRCLEIEDRLAAVEASGLKFFGVWQKALEYPRGAVVTHGGSCWVATKAHTDPEQPGTSDAWQLAVKAGRDGRDKT